MRRAHPYVALAAKALAFGPRFSLRAVVYVGTESFQRWKPRAWRGPVVSRPGPRAYPTHQQVTVEVQSLVGVSTVGAAFAA